MSADAPGKASGECAAYKPVKLLGGPVTAVLGVGVLQFWALWLLNGFVGGLVVSDTDEYSALLATIGSFLTWIALVSYTAYATYHAVPRPKFLFLTIAALINGAIYYCVIVRMLMPTVVDLLPSQDQLPRKHVVFVDDHFHVEYVYVLGVAVTAGFLAYSLFNCRKARVDRVYAWQRSTIFIGSGLCYLIGTLIAVFSCGAFLLSVGLAITNGVAGIHLLATVLTKAIAGAVYVVVGSLLCRAGSCLFFAQVPAPDRDPEVLFLRSFADDQTEIALPTRNSEVRSVWWINTLLAFGTLLPFGIGAWVSNLRELLATILAYLVIPVALVVYGLAFYALAAARRKFFWILKNSFLGVSYGAIGDPGETVPTFGLGWLYVRDEDWRLRVLQLMKKARLVVLVPGPSTGVAWEVRQIFEQGCAEKTLFLIPPPNGLQLDRKTNNEDSYAAFDRNVVCRIKCFASALGRTPEEIFRHHAISAGLFGFKCDSHGSVTEVFRAETSLSFVDMPPIDVDYEKTLKMVWQSLLRRKSGSC